MSETRTAGAACERVLSVRDHMVLQLWGRRWRYPAARDAVAEHEVGMRGTALAVRVAVLAEDPAAVAAYPALTRQVRAARGTGRRAVRAAA